MTTSEDQPPSAGVREPIRTAPRFLELLVCPLTKTSLEYDEKNQELISRAARLAYPIKSGVPYLLPSEARRLD